MSLRAIVHELYLLALSERTHLPLATQYHKLFARPLFFRTNDDSSIIVSQNDSNLLSGEEKVAMIWTYLFLPSKTPNTYEELRDLKWTYK